MQLYMDRHETACAVEIHTGIDRQITQMVWDRMEEQNPVFFRHYYIRVALKRQILQFNQLLEQQHQAMNFPPQNDSPVSMTNPENEAKSDQIPGCVGSEEVVGSVPHPAPCSSLAHSSLEAQGARITATLDSAETPISQVPNLIAGGHLAGNFRGPFQPSSSMAQSLSHVDSNLEGIHDI
ncbi:hypothetical protein BT93_I0649 [Corymbia citriodora subsp. variegata]|nr:hypothetical protein BT93_I0649 [Corymbia citriodora subsp. variegata]